MKPPKPYEPSKWVRDYNAREAAAQARSRVFVLSILLVVMTGIALALAVYVAAEGAR